MKRFDERRLIMPLGVMSAIAMVVVWFPFSTISSQGAQVNATNHQISVLQSESHALAVQQKSLSSPQAATLLAREEYQMVKPGQRLLQILSNGTSSLGTGDPGNQPLVDPSNAAGLLPDDPATNSSGSTSHPSLFSRVVKTLEFWR